MNHWEQRKLEEKIKEITGIEVSIMSEPWDYRISVRAKAPLETDTRRDMPVVNKMLKENGYKTRMSGGTWAVIKVK